MKHHIFKIQGEVRKNVDDNEVESYFDPYASFVRGRNSSVKQKSSIMGL